MRGQSARPRHEGGDRLAARVLALGIGLTVQRVLDASAPPDTFSEGVRALLGGAVRASSVA
jgi:hypothetical protein